MSLTPPALHSTSLWDQRWLPGLVFGLLAAIYLVNRSPYVGFNDGLSFLYAAETGFDWATNATSHFLYNNLQHLLLKLFFFLPSVLVLTLFSIGCSLGTLYTVYRSARLLSPTRPGVALLPTLCLGLAFTFWQQTEIIEVYAFNNLIFVSYCFLAIKDLITGSRRHYLLVSLFLGLGLLTHIQHILALPFFMAYLWWRNDLRPIQKIAGMLVWMTLMSVLFILPLFTQTNDLRAVFFESQFQEELLGGGVMTLLKGFLLGLGMLLYSFHLALWALGMGWRVLWQQNRTLVLWFLLLLLPFGAFAIKYSVNDNHVFYLIPYIIMVIPSGLALEKLLEKGKRMAWLLPAAILLPVLIYGATTLLAPKVPVLQAYNQQKAYKGGVVHLLWPGKCWAKDPLALAKLHFEGARPPEQDHIDEWNYETALRYILHTEP